MTNIDGSSHARAAHSSDDVRANNTETCANLTHLPHLTHLTEKSSSGYEDHPTSSTSTPERSTVDGSKAEPKNYAVINGWLCVWVGSWTHGDAPCAHEAGCGWEPIRRVEELLREGAAASSSPVDRLGSLRPVEEVRADLANAAVAPLWDTGRDVIGTGPVVRLLRDVPALLAALAAAERMVSLLAEQSARDEAANAELRAKIEAVEALAEKWEREAGPESTAWKVYGTQVVSVPFAVEQIRAALGGGFSGNQEPATLPPMQDDGFGPDQDLSPFRPPAGSSEPATCTHGGTGPHPLSCDSICDASAGGSCFTPWCKCRCHRGNCPGPDGASDV